MTPLQAALSLMPPAQALLGMVVAGLAVGWLAAACADPRVSRRTRADAERIFRRLMRPM